MNLLNCYYTTQKSNTHSHSVTLKYKGKKKGLTELEIVAYMGGHGKAIHALEIRRKTILRSALF